MEKFTIGKNIFSGSGKIKIEEQIFQEHFQYIFKINIRHENETK